MKKATAIKTKAANKTASKRVKATAQLVPAEMYTPDRQKHFDAVMKRANAPLTLDEIAKRVCKMSGGTEREAKYQCRIYLQVLAMFTDKVTMIDAADDKDKKYVVK